MSNKEKNEISSIFLEDEIIEKKDTKKRKKKNQNFSTSEVVLLVILTCVVSLIMGYFVSFKLGNNKLSDDMKKFVSDFEDVVDNYYEKVDEKELLSNALKSVINSLDDPYSGAIDTSSSTNTELNGSYSGFGIEVINTEDKLIKIVNVIEDSPAQKAKLKSGDIIIKLDGESVEGMTVSDFSNKVKASKKQTMKIVVKRDNEELDISITREIIELKSVSGEILEKNNKKVAYIYISIFAANTHNQFKKLLTEFEKKGFDSLIIDVRDNTGGHLTSVENIISLFLNKNKVIYQIDDKGSISKYYSTGNKNVKYKIAVLINGISASASEMLAGTLSEQCNAILVGEKTFGKGTVQELRQADSDVQYKLTTKKWLTPKGVWIHGKGIEPNFKIELNDEYIKNPTKENDNQLNKALEELTK